MLARFSPGEGVAIVGQIGAALILAEPSHPLVGALSRMLREPKTGITDLVDGLAREGISTLPDLGIVIRGVSASHCIVRGQVSIDYVLPSGEEKSIQGANVTAWKEDVVSAEMISIVIGGSPQIDHPFFVAEGIVPCGRLEVSLGGLPGGKAPSPDRPIEEIRVDDLKASPVETSWSETSDSHRDDLPSVDLSEPDTAVESSSEEPVASQPSGGENDGFDFTHLVDHTVYRHASDAVVTPDDLGEDSSGVPVSPRLSLEPMPELASSSQHTIPAPVTYARSEDSDRSGERGKGPEDQQEYETSGLSPTSESDLPGDHDGLTVVRRKRTRGRTDSGTHAVEPGGGVTLTGVSCPAGHGNDPISDRCLVCGAEISDRSLSGVVRPALGRLRLPSGEVFPIEGPMVIGRKPVAVGLIGGEVPSCVAIDEDLMSRNHAQIMIEGWKVLIADLKSTNHTTVVLPGQPPRVVNPAEPILITPGTEVFLGDFGPVVYEAGS